MPTQDWGVYPDALTIGTQVSSTYEGRYITATANELNQGNVLALVTKGRPVIFGIIAGNHGVGIAMTTEVAGTDLIAVDTEGIWNCAVSAIDDLGASLITGGDPLYINTTTAVVSKIRNNATQIPFGYALGQVVAAGVAVVIAVKVHWDPRSHWLEDEEMLYFGDARDVSIEWTSPLLQMLPLVDNTGTFSIGNGTLSMDVQIFGDLAGGANYMLYDSSESVLEVVNTISDEQDVVDCQVTEIGTHTGDSSAFHGALTKTAGAITGAGSVSAGRFDVVPRADVSHVYAVKTYTGVQAQGETVGDMSAYYCYCDNLGTDAGGFGSYACLRLNIDSTNPASGSAAGNSFFYLYSHGAAASQYFYIPDLQGATYMFNWPTAIVAPVEANADALAPTHRIACLVGGALLYLKLSTQ